MRLAAAVGLGAALLCTMPSPSQAQVLEIATDQSPVGLDPQVAFVFQASVLDVDAQEELAVALLVPPQVIVDVGDVDWMRIGQ